MKKSDNTELRKKAEDFLKSRGGEGAFMKEIAEAIGCSPAKASWLLGGNNICQEGQRYFYIDWHEIRLKGLPVPF